MAILQLAFLGTFHVTLDTQPVTSFESAKVRALLAYLAMQPERAYTRSALAGLLWPEQPEERARANLRQALANLRRALGDYDSGASFLLITRDSLQFDSAPDSRLDVALFEKLLDASSRHPHRRPELCTPCSQWLKEAVELYRGPFLDGMFVQESVALEEWILLQREVLQRKMLQALYQLAAYHERRGAYDEAHDYALRQIEIDPWREEAHRQVMRALMHKGERTAALAQFEVCRRSLADGLGVEPAEETTALYQQIRSAQDDVPLAANRLALPSTHPHNLPPQPTPFIGRERELAECAQVIEQQEYRLISLVGQGGSGKTRIALQAASEQIDGFLDGVRYVSLAPLQSGDYLPSAIAAAVGLSFSGQKDERTQLLDLLRDKEMLLVLDNFEHLLEAVDLVAAILRQAPSVTILTTSREPLNLQGEWIVPVEGLPCPSAASELPESFPAVQLFVQSARRVDSRFALSAEIQPIGRHEPFERQEARAAALASIAGICRLVGGLPLAIELAAAWTPVLSYEEIGYEISRSLDFLATKMHDVPERHRSLRAVFDYSWSLLSGEERDLLARLSAFRGGFRREAAEQGAGATLPLLSSLTAKSFLRRSALGRYEMHELLRQYAESKLREPAGGRAEEEARNLHCRYYAGFVESREVRLHGKEQLSARQEINAEIDNVREAWRWAVEQKRWEDLSKLEGGLWFFYEMGGLLPEADTTYEQAAAGLRLALADGPVGSGQWAVGSGQTSEQWAELADGQEPGSGQSIAEEPALPTAHRPLPTTRYSTLPEEESRTLTILLGRLLAHRGGILGCRMGRIQEGRNLVEQSVSLFRRFDERGETAFSLNLLGSIARSLCQYERAREYFQESLDLAEAIGDRWERAYSLSDLGNVAYLLGKYEEARRLHGESLLISRRTGDRRAMMFCLNDGTEVAIALGDYEDGMGTCREALALAQEIVHRWGEATALCHMGVMKSYTGDYPQAEDLLQESLAAFQEMGDRQGSTLPLQQLGYLSYLRNEYAQAQQLLQRALSDCRVVGYPRGSAAALNGLGRVAHRLGEVAVASAYLREALATAARIQAWPLVMDILVSMARVEAASPVNGLAGLSWRLLSIAYNHSATESHTREEACALQAELGLADLAGSNEVLADPNPASALEQIPELQGLLEASTRQ